MRYFLSGLSGGGFQAIGGSTTNMNINTGSISSARCYEPGQVLGMVLEEVDARGTSRRVFVDRLSASYRPLPQPGTQSATSGSITRTVFRNLPGAASATPLNRRLNGTLPTVSVAQIRVNTTLLPDSSNRHLLKTYFTADAARSPVVLCVPDIIVRKGYGKIDKEIFRKGYGKIDKEKFIRKIGKTSIWTIPATVQTTLTNAEAARREAERQADLARQAKTDRKQQAALKKQQAALNKMAKLLAEAERAAAEALAAANAAAARAQSAEERAIAAEAKVSAQTTVAVVEEVKDVASDVGVTSDGNGNVVIDPEVTPTPPDVLQIGPSLPPRIGPSLPPEKSKTPLFLLAAAAVGGYFLLKG